MQCDYLQFQVEGEGGSRMGGGGHWQSPSPGCSPPPDLPRHPPLSPLPVPLAFIFATSPVLVRSFNN